MTDKDVLRYYFVSSYGREGPFEDLAVAFGRAQTLALKAAIDGRDEERPVVECSDGTRQKLPPFGNLLTHEHLQELPRAQSPGGLEERRAVEYLISCMEEFEDRMRSHYSQLSPSDLRDKGARAIYLWTLRRTALAIMQRLPELRPLADQWHRRWFGEDD